MRNVEFMAAVALLTGCSIVTGPAAGPGLNDLTLTAAVKTRLALSKGFRSLTGVHVNTDGEVVLLTGQVDDTAAHARIDEVVRRLAGGHRVNNQLTVLADSTATAATAAR